MSLTLERMRYNVRLEMGGLDSTDIDDTDVDELLNLSLWQLEDSFPFRTREKNFEETLVDGQYTYDLSSITRLDAIASVAVIITETGKRQKLARQDRAWWDANFFTEDNDGTPERYFRERNTLFLTPIPDLVESTTIEVAVRQGVASLLEGSVETTGLPRSWDEIVVAGAVWRGHKTRRNYNLAQQAANFQIGLIRSAVPVEAKEEKDSRYARLNVLHDWPEDFEE